MRRGYMTDRENEEQKRRTRYMLQDRRLISEVYPEVEQIVIEYAVEHRSAFGIGKDSRTITCAPSHSCIFEVDCLNRECTCGYFNLKEEVWSMVRGKETERTGTMNCKGSEAPDHLYQSCGGSLEYKITIAYKP